VTLLLTVSHSVSLGITPNLGLMTKYLQVLLTAVASIAFKITFQHGLHGKHSLLL
jgi:hypothetical protein